MERCFSTTEAPLGPVPNLAGHRTNKTRAQKCPDRGSVVGVTKPEPGPFAYSPFRFLPHKYQVIIIMAPALWSIERVPGADVKWGAPPSAFRGWWVSPLS